LCEFVLIRGKSLAIFILRYYLCGAST